MPDVTERIQNDWPASRWDELIHGTGCAAKRCRSPWRHERNR
ncbi:hypothetical protein [Mesorhizobium sp. M0119]